jgi:two-component sensor histidine kinase
VEDEGIGWDGAGAAKGTGLGTKVINAMLTNLNSTLAFGSVDKGTRSSFEFDV